MPQTVQVPGQGIVTFPDDATPDEIKSALDKHYPISSTPAADEALTETASAAPTRPASEPKPSLRSFLGMLPANPTPVAPGPRIGPDPNDPQAIGPWSTTLTSIGLERPFPEKGDNLAMQTLNAIMNFPVDAANFGLSPAGAVTIGALPELHPVIQRLVAAGFTADQIKNAVQSPNWQEALGNLLGAATTGIGVVKAPSEIIRGGGESADSIGKTVETERRPQASGVEQGAQSGVRVREATQDRVETAAGAPQTETLRISPEEPQSAQPAPEGGDVSSAAKPTISFRQPIESSQPNVDSLVRGIIGQHDDVFRSIIGSVPIDMVNDFLGTKWTPDELLRNKSVLVNQLSVNSTSPIAQAITVRIKDALARFGTEVSDPKLAGLSSKGFAAVRAFNESLGSYSVPTTDVRTESILSGQEGKIPQMKGGSSARERQKASDQGQRGQGQEETPLTQTGAETPPAPDATGIKQTIHAKRTEGEVVPGEGMSAEQMVERGRDLLRQGADPHQIVLKISSGGGVSGDEMAVLRAHVEQLSRATNATADAALDNPNNPAIQSAAEKAWNLETEWRQKIKPAQTEWQKAGAAQQGETDIDTGSFTGIRRAVQQEHGRDLKPTEEAQAKKIAGEVSGLDQKIDQIKSQIFSDVDQLTFGSQFGASIRPDAAPLARIRSIWKHAKDNYIDHGESDFDEMIHGTAQDLGLTPDEVRDAIAAPKSGRKMTTEMYRLMSLRRTAQANAKAWVRSLNDPLLKKAWNTVTRIPYSVAVLGHAVVMETHGGSNLYRPSAWKTFWPNVGNQFRFWGDRAYHEKLMQGLVRDPDYFFWKRAGLAVDPQIAYDPYQMYSRWLGKLSAIGEAGNRSMDAIKTYRLSEAKRIWQGTPSNLKTGDYAKEISKVVNHSSGVSDIGHGPVSSGLQSLMFAAKLEASRWARIIGDPIKTGNTLVNWRAATPAQRSAALLRLRRASEFSAVLLGSLAANEGLLQALGSSQHINFNDPRKPDFLRHKIGGKTVDLSGGLLQPVRFLARVIATFAGPPPTRGAKRFDVAGEQSARYARGKLSPFYGTATDIASQADYMGRPMPFSSDKAPADKPRYTWTEYFLEQRGPIPASGAIREITDTWKQKGMSNTQIQDYLRALAVFGAEATGIRVGDEPTAPHVSQKRHSRFQVIH